MALVTVVELLLKLPLMHPQQLRRKAKRRPSSSFTRRASSPSISYLKTRIRGSRLLNAARLLVLIELTHRLHQAYRFAYDKQAADWLLPQNPTPEQRAADRAGQMLNQQRCRDFVRALLLKADQLASPTFGGPIRTRFSAPLGLNGQPDPNYPPANYALDLYRTAIAQGRVGRAGTHQGDANTIGVTNSRTFVVQWNAAFYSLSSDERAQHTIHESLHQEPTFNDNTLARAAGLVANGREPGRNDLRSVSSASQFLNSILFQYCR